MLCFMGRLSELRRVVRWVEGDEELDHGEMARIGCEELLLLFLTCCRHVSKQFRCRESRKKGVPPSFELLELGLSTPPLATLDRRDMSILIL